MVGDHFEVLVRIIMLLVRIHFTSRSTWCSKFYMIRKDFNRSFISTAHAALLVRRTGMPVLAFVPASPRAAISRSSLDPSLLLPSWDELSRPMLEAFGRVLVAAAA